MLETEARVDLGVDLDAEVPCEMKTCTAPRRPAEWRLVVAHEDDGSRCRTWLVCSPCRERGLAMQREHRAAIVARGGQPRPVCGWHPGRRAVAIWTHL